MYLEVSSMFEKKPNGFVCSKCGCNKADYIGKRHVYQCRECKHQESVTAKTALNSTKLPLLDWILVMFVFVVSKTGISAQCISDITGVSYKSVKLMLRKIKAAQKENNDKYPVLNCDASRTNKSLKLEGKLMDIQAFEKGNNHLTSADHMISNLKKKVDGMMHGIELQYLENELADFEWKIARRKRNGKQLLESLGRTLIHGTNKTRKGLIQHFKQVEENMAVMYA